MCGLVVAQLSVLSVYRVLAAQARKTSNGSMQSLRSQIIKAESLIPHDLECYKKDRHIYI